MRRILGYILSPLLPKKLIYMLQVVEYSPSKFFKWLLRGPNLSRIENRGELKLTLKAKALILFGYGLWLIILGATIYALVRGRIILAIVVWLLSWLLLAIMLAVVVWVFRNVLSLVRHGLLGKTNQLLAGHSATKIAVLGSYGKTSMKEILNCVLSEKFIVKATPGNMNVPISHARWATRNIEPDDEIIIFEYGEGAPGDIKKFANLTHPNIAVITGIAPNHLDRYKTIEKLHTDLTSINDYVNGSSVIVNGEPKTNNLAREGNVVYGSFGVADWSVKDIRIDFSGTTFTIVRANSELKLKTKLLGKHQIGAICAAVYLADKLGLSDEQIISGVAKTKPFSHRMEPKQLHGAWIIDDTYNGNLEGMKAGLQLLNDLPGKKKIYVTPGLVDQGKEREGVHRQIGEAIAQIAPDQVVLMKNSVTDYILSGIESKQFKGELVIEPNPLQFYQSLEHRVKSGDVVLMQNDWTDNYY